MAEDTFVARARISRLSRSIAAAVGAAALLVAVVAWWGAADRGRGDDPGGAAWESLPDAPLEGRANAAAVATDEGVVVWGGGFVAPMGTHPGQEMVGHSGGPDRQAVALGQVSFADGAVLDPVSGMWIHTAPAPVAGGSGAQAVWTGQEVILLVTDTSGGIHVASYRPAADRWRPIDHPLEPGSVVEVVWTGTQMLLWGAFDHQPDRGDIGYAYDPVDDRWRRLPEAPVPARQWHSAVWTGQEMIVWGGTDLVGPAGGLRGAAYAPATDRWRELAPAPIAARHRHSAVWTGQEMIVWGGQNGGAYNDGAAYDPAGDRWRQLAEVPLQGRIGHVAVWDGAAMVVWGGSPVFEDEAFGDGAAYLPGQDRWLPLPPSPLAPRCDAAATASPAGIVVWGGQVGCNVQVRRRPPPDGALLRVSLPASNPDRG